MGVLLDIVREVACKTEDLTLKANHGLSCMFYVWRSLWHLTSNYSNVNLLRLLFVPRRVLFGLDLFYLTLKITNSQSFLHPLSTGRDRFWEKCYLRGWVISFCLGGGVKNQGVACLGAWVKMSKFYILTRKIHFSVIWTPYIWKFPQSGWWHIQFSKKIKQRFLGRLR